MDDFKIEFTNLKMNVRSVLTIKGFIHLKPFILDS